MLPPNNQNCITSCPINFDSLQHHPQRHCFSFIIKLLITVTYYKYRDAPPSMYNTFKGIYTVFTNTLVLFLHIYALTHAIFSRFTWATFSFWYFKMYSQLFFMSLCWDFVICQVNCSSLILFIFCDNWVTLPSLFWLRLGSYTCSVSTLIFIWSDCTSCPHSTFSHLIQCSL
jgi:hypothetical protein